ncbi:MAG: imidazole glycerol phosphate synthase subunit HisH, partial [Novosphingobium sp.]|nr:imidazole glycerol phosphate synthase subunit HisH [Novosphingobium sp.]
MAEVVALVDYGAGNLHSVANALRAAGAKGVKVTSDPDAVRAADRVVLPGVGSFKACAEGLR